MVITINDSRIESNKNLYGTRNMGMTSDHRCLILPHTTVLFLLQLPALLHSSNAGQVDSQLCQHSQIFCTHRLLFMDSPAHLYLNATSQGKPFLSPLDRLKDIHLPLILWAASLKQYALILYYFLYISLLGLSFLRLEQVFAYPTPNKNPSTK